MVSVLVFYSIYPSSNPAEVYSFNSENWLQRAEMNKKDAGAGPFLKKTKREKNFEDKNHEFIKSVIESFENVKQQIIGHRDGRKN